MSQFCCGSCAYPRKWRLFHPVPDLCLVDDLRNEKISYVPENIELLTYSCNLGLTDWSTVNCRIWIERDTTSVMPLDIIFCLNKPWHGAFQAWIQRAMRQVLYFSQALKYATMDNLIMWRLTIKLNTVQSHFWQKGKSVMKQLLTVGQRMPHEGLCPAAEKTGVHQTQPSSILPSTIPVNRGVSFCFLLSLIWLGCRTLFLLKSLLISRAISLTGLPKLSFCMQGCNELRNQQAPLKSKLSIGEQITGEKLLASFHKALDNSYHDFAHDWEQVIRAVIGWVGLVLLFVDRTYLGKFPHCRVDASVVAVLEQLS